MRTFFPLLATLLLVSGPALAETFRVTPSKARSLPAVLSQLRGGDTLIFERGTYNIQNGLQLAEANSVTLMGEGKVEIVLGNLDEAVLTVNNCTRVHIKGLRARHETPSEEYQCEGAVIEIRDSSHVAVSDCELNGCGAAGVYATSSKDLAIVNNKIFNNSYAGVWFYQSSAVVRGNHIFKNAAEIVTGGDCDVTMLDNKCENNRGNDYSTDWVHEVLQNR